MIVYILTFAVSLLLYYTIVGNKRIRLVSVALIKPNRKWVISKFTMGIFLASIPPMFISAVRYYVGTDYFKTYYTGFYRILDGNVIDGFEPGFYLLNKLIQLFSDSAFWLFAITSILFVGIVYKAIAKSSIDVPLSIILFLVTRYYFIGMNGVRQFIGIAILTYSLRYVFEREPIKYGFCIFFACMFHYTCILFAPIYFVSKIQLTIRRIIYLMLIDILCFTIGKPLFLYLLSGTRYGWLSIRYNLAGIKFTVFTIILNISLFLIGYM